jgi:excisionase family DNA binding protein
MTNLAEPKLTVGQVAIALGVSQKSVRRWIRRKQIAAFKLPSGDKSQWRIPKSAVDQLMNEGRIQTEKEERLR